jgi:hypothetical protein
MDRMIATEAAKTDQTEQEVRTSFTQAASPQGASISGQEIVVDGNTDTL